MDALTQHLPPLSAYAWLVPLYLQCILLHPRIPARLSRALRLVLIVPTTYLTLRAPSNCFTPRDTTRFWNAGFGFMALYGLSKGVEWGCVTDRTAYDWVGFGKGPFEKQISHKEAIKRKEPPRDDEVTQSRRKEGWIKVLLSQAHLMMSFRHLGYRACTLAPPPPTTTTVFLRDTLIRWAISHTIFTLGMAFVTSSVADKYKYILAVAPWLGGHPNALEWARQGCASLIIAAMVYGGLMLTHAIYSMGYFFGINIGRALGLPLDPFEPREYAPLFRRPFAPTSVKNLWGKEWHQLIRRTFLLFGTHAFSLSRRLGLSPPLAQLSAALAVVLATSAIHEFALGSAIAGLDTLGPRASFTQRHGGALFFSAMVALGACEAGFRVATGRRVSGVAGFVWTATAAGAAAMAFLRPTWGPTYLLKGVPEAGEWGWVRWVVPLASGAPAPLWTKA